MKKKLFLPVIVLLISFSICSGQEKVEKYCEVRIYSRWNDDNRQKISINIGNTDTNFKDSSILNSLLAIDNFHNTVDVLDYMAKLGWDIVTISSIHFSTTKIYFKKVFDKSEFKIVNN
ncbi:MAG: hypothetical protein JST58_00045 [Bacteroidetes bacterium]|nr:hypothetical protein [Bacteroidota bacterium]